ncbi:MAG: hypothetical protein KGL74_03445, partial [Elusimicrobia bacterium]|nr:hypothetical protein [Elusimicrobiota bacterium]
RLRRGLGRSGTTLLETVLAIVLMTIAGLAIVAVLQKATVASLKARQRMTCSRLTDAGMARLKNIDYYYLFAVDSSSTNWATPPLHASGANAYPYTSVLTGLQSSLSASKFDRFKVDVVFMRRDSTDSKGTGNTNNLIPFKDNGFGADAYDPNIRYNDANGDGDYYETYVSSGRTVAEQPDTHLKLVTLSVYRSGSLACSKSEMISLEQFTGATNPDSESVLTLELSTPTNSSFAYRMTTTAQIAARALSLANSYPPDIQQYRADASVPLVLAGVTEPLATESFYVGSSGVLASATADVFGAFSASPAAVTSALVEGQNTVHAVAAKSSYSSPVADRSILLDISPPTITGMTPTGAVATCAPYVSAVLADPAVSTAAASSGIYAGVTAMKINGSTVPFFYNPAVGTIVWIATATQTSPVVSSGTFTAAVETGDYAGYKSSVTWTFSASVPATDASAPSISNKSPIGMAGSDLPTISVRVFDNQSGIDPTSLSMTLDGATIMTGATAGSYYDPSSGTIAYAPSSAFMPGTYHTVTISVNHCATNPGGAVTSADSWGFTAP